MPVLDAAQAEFEISANVVVIGAGACGLAAALAAREAGAVVLVLERDARPTGSTSLSTGLLTILNDEEGRTDLFWRTAEAATGNLLRAAWTRSCTPCIGA